MPEPITDWIDAGKETVATHAHLPLHWTGRAAASGAPVEMKMAQVWTVEGGRIRRGEEYYDRAEALEAAGLQD